MQQQFRMENGRIVALTEVGEGTVEFLPLNEPERVLERVLFRRLAVL